MIKIKVMLLPLILLTFQANAASTYLFTLNNNISNDVQIVDKDGNRTDIYNENGFLSNGMHQNNTLYDDSGYDIDGYDIEGLGELFCLPFNNTNGAVKAFWLNGSIYYFDYDNYPHSDYKYSGGDYKGQVMVGSTPTSVYVLCRQKRKNSL